MAYTDHVQPIIELAGTASKPSFLGPFLEEGGVTTRLHIGNIPTTATEYDLEAMFRQFGLVESVGIRKDRPTGLSSGSAYVVMCNEMDAESAINRLNFSQYGGRTISVSRSRLGQQGS